MPRWCNASRESEGEKGLFLVGGLQLESGLVCSDGCDEGAEGIGDAEGHSWRRLSGLGVCKINILWTSPLHLIGSCLCG